MCFINDIWLPSLVNAVDAILFIAVAKNARAMTATSMTMSARKSPLPNVSLNALIERGHTVLIIEHNMDVIKCADNIIDLGPEGGSEGGYLVFEGTPEELIKCETSYTGKYLAEKLQENK